MPSNLTSQYIKFTYRQLLHVSDGVTASLKTVYSGLGVATALKVSVGSVAVDNLKFDGNVISSTDTNGDITLTPNGTGKVNIGAVNITGGLITGLSSPLPIASGGTGGATAAAARAALGISEAGSAALAVSLNLSDLANPVTARQNLGVEIGVDVQAWSANLDGWSAAAVADYATTAYVTSAISTAGGSYQPLNSKLTDISAATVTAAGITALGFADPNADRIMFWDDSASGFAGLTLPAAGLSITDTTLGLANDLAALEGLASTGFAVRSATDTWLQRSVAGTAAEISVTNGDGVSGNPTISLPTALTFTGKTITGGTLSGITLGGTVSGTPTVASAWTWSTAQNFPTGSQVNGVNIVTLSASQALTGKTYNGLSITTTTGTLTITNGKTLSVSNTVTLTATDGATLAIGGGGTLGAAAYKNTGTSGNNVALLDGANEWGAIQRFGTVGDNGPKFNNPYWAWMNAAGTRKAYIQAVSAGTLTIQPESDTVGVRINVNGGAATVEGDTIATLTATQTLSNKTLSSPLFSGSAGSALTFAQGYGPNFANSGATHGIFDYNNTTFIMTYNTADWKTSVRLLSTSIQLYANNGLASWDGTTFTVGDASVAANLRVNGTASGTAGGAYINVQNNSSTNIAIGNYSAIIGGAYDATTLFYSAAAGVKFRVGGSVTWLDVNSAGQATFIHNIKWGSSAQGTLTFSGSDAYIDAAGDMNLRAGGGTTFAIGRTTGLQAKPAAITTTTGTLVVADANCAGTLTGGITLPNAVFSARDSIVWHAGTSAKTITRGASVTMYVNGTNVASATLAANCVGGCYWSDASTVHLTGAIT